MPDIKNWMNAVKGSPRGLLGSAADVLAVLTVIFSGGSLVLNGAFPQDVLAIVISGLALAFLAISFKLQKRLMSARLEVARSVQLGYALPKLAEATTGLARAGLAAQEEPSRSFLALTERASQVLAEMFGIATGQPCRVTVVEVYAPPVPNQRPGVDARLAVRRICSSSPPTGRRRPAGQIDWVDENTDFKYLFDTGEPFFYCNDLPTEIGNGYQNSHWPRDKIAEMRKNDSFPYKSTIVWSIRAWDTDADGGEWDVAGFLCVDSKNTNVFDPALDVATGQAFASALYLGLATYQAWQESFEDVADANLGGPQ